MTNPERSGSEQGSGGPSPSGSRGQVTVGIDGSEAAAHALRWANHKASVFGEVTPLAAYQRPVTLDLMTTPSAGSNPSLHRDAAEKRLEYTVAAEAPHLLPRAELMESHPGAGLVEAAADANLLVVGTRGHNALATALLGSVSAYCVNHSGVPVALIPPEWAATRPLSVVVVGVDGSDNAKRALRWVVQNLAPHLGADGKILAVGAFSVSGYAEVGYDPPLAELEAASEETVATAVAAVTGPSYDGPDIEIRIESQDPRGSLPRITQAEGDLLVIGARGVSGISHLLLGSVASALVHHPKVATIVVPAAD